jgi:hypothetical protein
MVRTYSRHDAGQDNSSRSRVFSIAEFSANESWRPGTQGLRLSPICLFFESTSQTALWLANCKRGRMKRTPPSALYGASDDFNFFIHDLATSFRIEVEGNLSRKAVMQIEQSWHTASSVIGTRALVIAIGDVRSVDPEGHALVRKWHQAGARFVTKSPSAPQWVSAIAGQPVISDQEGAEAEAAKKHDCAWFRAMALAFVPLIALLFPAKAIAASLEPAASKAWNDYVDSANVRMEQRLAPGKTFLWVDEALGRLAQVRSGEIVVAPVGPQNPKKVPSGLIHDWVGAAFIPDVTLNDVLHVVRDYARYKDSYQPNVVDSKVIATSESKDRFSMLLMNKALFLKTAIDTDYESRFVTVDDRRLYSVSRTTRVQEIEEYGAPGQRALPEGVGHGLIWRLFNITRYAERDGGVYLELEVVGLSRDIPASVRWLVEPIVRRVSRGSLATSLRQTENAVRMHAELADGKSGRQGNLFK